MSEPFTFAVIADTHTRPEEGDLSSPWEVNKLANARARYVAARVAQIEPAFTIHLGDVVHPVPALPTYGPAADAALEIMSVLDHDVRYIPGNHDVGDKPFKANPAGMVTDEGVALYKQYFGAPYASFDHEDCHFVLINSPVLNSGLEAEAEQRPWLEADLEANQGKRIFLFTHYPPYVHESNEPSNYDNIDEPERSWLLGLVEHYRIEALFAGHVHNFFYHRHGVTDCYLLPATSFFRQDYAELFRVEAADEHGRNDAAKLGFFTVEVRERDHVARIHRTDGRTLERGEAPPPAPVRVAPAHPRERRRAPVGVHLRHPWAEVTEFPYNGPMDEFLRKRVRNDYTLMTLWELGVRKLRVPISDVQRPEVRERMHALRKMGHTFTVFVFGDPDDAMINALDQHIDLVNVLEIIAPWNDAEAIGMSVRDLSARLEVPVTIAKMETSAEKHTEGSKFSHFVSYGFRSTEGALIDAFRDNVEASASVDGFVFRLLFGESPWEAVPVLSAFAHERGIRAVANLRLASENPAEYNEDDLGIANQVAEGLLSGFAHPDVEVFIDTYVDVDRGYFPRHGLFDRRYNPRLGSFVYRHLQGYLSAMDETPVLGERRDLGNAAVGWASAGARTLGLVLPRDAGEVSVELPQAGAWERIALATGEIEAIEAGSVVVAGDAPVLLVKN